ncbi:MAG: FtsX-like permease family protein [Pseudomonadota bacterium]|nr:FtsX-like permease family protein [Pseudomonadota bacterium]
MLRSFPLFIGLRYSLAQKNSLLLSFVSLISVLGVTLGVLILIVALAVINGSIETLRKEALKSTPHVTIAGPGLQANWRELRDLALRSEGVIAAAPFIEAEASITHQGEAAFIAVRGIDTALESSVNEPGSATFVDLLASLGESETGVILGAGLAGQLGVRSSTQVSLLSLGKLLRRRLDEGQGAEVIGFADFGLYSNHNTALMSLTAAERLFANDPGVDIRLRLRVSDINRAGDIAAQVFSDYPELEITPWNEVQASLFDALNMEKFLTAFMLLMIVVIGAVNIISTLVMFVSDKSADIAILRTMGASQASIMIIFMVQGLVAGILGTVIGVALGLVLAGSITDVSLALEQFVNSNIEGANLYLLSHLQTEVVSSEVMLVCLAALVTCFLATLYPAYRASCIQPAEVLRYE